MQPRHAALLGGPCTRRCLSSPSAHRHERSLRFLLDRTRQRAHIWVLMLLCSADPWSSENICRLTQTNSGLSERSGTQKGHRWRGAAASAQMAAWLCVCVCVFLRQQGLTGTAVSQHEVWWELGTGMKGWRRLRWRGAFGDEGITKSWQLLFFFPDRVFIPTAVWGENSFFTFLLTFFGFCWHIFDLSIFKIKIKTWLKLLHIFVNPDTVKNFYFVPLLHCILYIPFLLFRLPKCTKNSEFQDQSAWFKPRLFY